MRATRAFLVIALLAAIGCGDEQPAPPPMPVSSSVSDAAPEQRCDLPAPQVCIPEKDAGAPAAGAATAQGPFASHAAPTVTAAEIAAATQSAIEELTAAMMSKVNVAADNPDDTVTKRSNLIYPDNISGCYRWSYSDGTRFASSPVGVCGADLYLHEVCYNCPSGVITGSAYWFPGPDGTQPIIPIQQNTQWSSSAAGWWEQDPVTGIWFWTSCSRRTSPTVGWNCTLYEENPFPPGQLIRSGSMTLTLLYGHAGN